MNSHFHEPGCFQYLIPEVIQTIDKFGCHSMDAHLYKGIGRKILVTARLQVTDVFRGRAMDRHFNYIVER